MTFQGLKVTISPCPQPIAQLLAPEPLVVITSSHFLGPYALFTHVQAVATIQATGDKAK